MNYADALISYILQLYRFQTTGLGAKGSESNAANLRLI